MKKLSILGSTGSIGCQTLEVVRRSREDFQIDALSCGTNIELMIQQANEFRPKLISVALEKDVFRVKEALSDLSVEVLYGSEGNLACASFSSTDMVVAAMVGVSGLEPVLAAIDAGKDIALANKETLVAGGSIVMPKLIKRNVRLLPVDSEHSAIWQCLWGQPDNSLEKILLTASGGPFRGFTAEQLRRVTVGEALSHPTWKMGGKITIDSASMMNKGLEVIEAAWLFGVSVDQVTVVVHPQSIIHSMVRMKDGSVLAQIGRPNMMLPIQIALMYPERGPLLCEPFDPFAAGSCDLHFEACDETVFPCLSYAYHAGRSGGSLPVVLNAANEEAVAAFLSGRISFSGIPACVYDSINEHEKSGVVKIDSFSDVQSVDQLARQTARAFLSKIDF